MWSVAISTSWMVGGFTALWSIHLSTPGSKQVLLIIYHKSNALLLIRAQWINSLVQNYKLKTIYIFLFPFWTYGMKCICIKSEIRNLSKFDSYMVDHIIQTNYSLQSHSYIHSNRPWFMLCLELIKIIIEVGDRLLYSFIYKIYYLIISRSSHQL